MPSAGYLANRIARLYAAVLRNRMSDLGIAPGQLPILLALWEKNGLTQTELLDMLQVKQATLSNTLSRMERDRIISRRKHEADTRARTIHLTERGRSVCTAAAQISAQLDKEVFAGLSNDEKRAFTGFIYRVIGKITESEGAAPSVRHELKWFN